MTHFLPEKNCYVRLLANLSFHLLLSYIYQLEIYMATSKFPIYRLEDRSTTEIGREDDGRFFKYWANGTKLGRCLFKAAFPYDSSVDYRYAEAKASPTPRFRQQHRMDWREKVAAELGNLLGLPMAQTELATIYYSPK